MQISFSIEAIEALIGVSGDVDPAHFECYETETEGEQVQQAFETAINKLEEALQKLRLQAQRRKG